MKKSLIALAALATVGAAQAQSSVSISGLIDLGVINRNHDQTLYSSTGVGPNGTATSNLTFSGSEDLGGGLRAGFSAQTDWVVGSNATADFLNSQNFVNLTSAQFGDIRMGNVNTAALSAATTAQPFGTGIGGGYSGEFSRLSYIGVNGSIGASGTASTTGNAQAEGEQYTATNGAISGTRVVRANNTIKYTTPTFNGFSASYAKVFNNDNAAANASTGQQEIAVSYSGKGLNVVAASYEFKADVGAVPTGGLASGTSVKHNLIGANYAVPMVKGLTVYAGYTTSKHSLANTADSKSTNFAVRYELTPKLAVLGNVIKVDDKLSGNKDRDLTGLGLDYSLSKRTLAYVRYEDANNDKTASNKSIVRTAVGLRHSF